MNTPVGSRRLALEWFAILPDHFLEVRRDSFSGPISHDIVYYTGIAGTRPIRKTHSTLPMPEPRFADNSPEAVAARERAMVLQRTQAFARLVFAWYGTATSAYPMQFAHLGQEQAEGKTYDVVEASALDGFRCRLHVDSTTHLPAMLTWMDEIPHVVTMTSSSMVTTRNGQVVGQTPPANSGTPVIPEGNRGMAPRRWLFKDFKVQDGIKWPRVIEEEFEGKTEEIRLGRVKINPEIEARKFDVK
jgi:hypothetical protein